MRKQKLEVKYYSIAGLEKINKERQHTEVLLSWNCLNAETGHCELN